MFKDQILTMHEMEFENHTLQWEPMKKIKEKNNVNCSDNKP